MDDQPDIDICPDCGEHADFEEGESSCCGAPPYMPDNNPYSELER